jgi:SAM-dependent methyltransferase
MRALEARHLADLTFPEVARALRALSSAYVERRSRIGGGGALAGAGKRAAFALFYGPLHYLLVREIVRALPGATRALARIVDLGCGTGAAGAAWARALTPRPRILGVDRHPWALAESAHAYRGLGLQGRAIQRDLGRVELPRERCGLLAAYSLNELAADARDALMRRLLDRAAAGDRVLIVEPLAGFVAPWWGRWRREVESAGGRADEWRVRVALPPVVDELDRAAGLHHREITGRSLWLP